MSWEFLFVFFSSPFLQELLPVNYCKTVVQHMIVIIVENLQLRKTLPGKGKYTVWWCHRVLVTNNQGDRSGDHLLWRGKFWKIKGWSQ